MSFDKHIWSYKSPYDQTYHQNQNMEYCHHPKMFPQFKFVGVHCKQAFPSNRENGTICLSSLLGLCIHSASMMTLLKT